jgi:hypothetical protein
MILPHQPITVLGGQYGTPHLDKFGILVKTERQELR